MDDTAETAIQEDHTQLLEKFIAVFGSQLEPAFSFGPFSLSPFRRTLFFSDATPSRIGFFLIRKSS